MPKEYIFKNVVLIKPYVFLLVGVVVLGPIFYGLLLLASSYLYVGNVWAIVFIVGTYLLLFSCFSRTVVISFDATHFYLKVNKKTHVYLKEDLVGFYSFDYNHTQNCTVSISFNFVNGKKISLSNYTLNAGKFDPDKHQMLIDFLKTAQNELGFKAVSINKARTISKIGNVWFAKAVL